jgi:hypothetical protein
MARPSSERGLFGEWCWYETEPDAATLGQPVGLDETVGDEVANDGLRRFVVVDKPIRPGGSA